MKKLLLVATVLAASILMWQWIQSGDTSAMGSGESTEIRLPQADEQAQSAESSSSGDATPSMSDVLAMARESLEQMRLSLDDYTASFVKQERDKDGVLSESTEIFMKAQTRFRGPDNQSPRRVYLRFQSPTAVAGREVIWGEDIYDGKMAVHEVGMIFGLKTIWLDPNGMIAMQGQRFPISEIGLVKMVEKLIDRGQQDVGNADIKVSIDDDHTFDGLKTQLIRVRRTKPSGDEEDFSSAEIVVDPERQLVLCYRSFGWPKKPSDEPPLLESYQYRDLKTNVGLTDADFQTTNSEYRFPRF